MLINVGTFFTVPIYWSSERTLQLSKEILVRLKTIVMSLLYRTNGRFIIIEGRNQPFALKTASSKIK